MYRAASVNTVHLTGCKENVLAGQGDRRYHRDALGEMLDSGGLKDNRSNKL